jgi:hypothetical protein
VKGGMSECEIDPNSPTFKKSFGPVIVIHIHTSRIKLSGAEFGINFLFYFSTCFAICVGNSGEKKAPVQNMFRMSIAHEPICQVNSVWRATITTLGTFIFAKGLWEICGKVNIPSLPEGATLHGSS